MRMLCSLVLLSLLAAPTVEARPSFRSLRENAVGEKYNSDDPTQAGWRKKYFEPSGWGLRTTYPSSWNEPLWEAGGTSVDGAVPYSYARLIPGYTGVGKRKNYILELYALRWDVGTQMTQEEVSAFSSEQTAYRFREYERRTDEPAEVAGLQGWKRTFSSMTGHREETWFSQGRYLYTIGYRSLWDYVEDDHFFYEEMLESVVVTPVEETNRVTPTPFASTQSDQPSPVQNVQVDPNAIFSDVPDSHPYAPAIAWAKESGIVGGYPDGTFQPDRAVNRAEFLKIVLGPLSIDMNYKPRLFPDLELGAWYLPYIANAKALMIVNGYPDGTFKPGKTVNTAEALKMAYKALGIRVVATDAVWYAPYYDHALVNSVFQEFLEPQSDMRRKDVVWILWKLENL